MSASFKMVETSEKYDDTESQNTAKTKKPRRKDNRTPFEIIFIAEIVGTAILMFLGCMGTCAPNFVPIPVIPHMAGIGFGLAVITAIQIIGHITGAHLNPQVSIAALILGKITFIEFIVYVVAEFIGALIGHGFLKVLVPYPHNIGLCDTMPHADVTAMQAVGIEAVITGALILCVCAAWDPRNADKQDSGGIRIGLVVVCLCLSAGSLTAASLNTARSFAPALINNSWGQQWIYLVGPTIGAVVAAGLYKYVLLK